MSKCQQWEMTEIQIDGLHVVKPALHVSSGNYLAASNYLLNVKDSTNLPSFHSVKLDSFQVKMKLIHLWYWGK